MNIGFDNYPSDIEHQEMYGKSTIYSVDFRDVVRTSRQLYNIRGSVLYIPGIDTGSAFGLKSYPSNISLL